MRIIIDIIEILRITGICGSIAYAHFFSNDAVVQLHVMTPLVIVFLSGLTGIESLFLSKYAAERVGYRGGEAYQRQSGMNNLSVAMTSVIVWWFQWGTKAEAALMAVTLLFYAMSGINHAYNAIGGGNKKTKNWLRPLWSLALIIAVLPILLAALR